MFMPLLATGLIGGLLLRFAHWLLLGRSPELSNERKLPRQLFMLFLTFAVGAALAMSLPVSEGNKNQVLGLLGLIVSGLFAFSSTTIVANLMAGGMLRVTRPFRTGDFIRVGENFGRVSDLGLLDTEIQTEHRDLIALPNTYLITNPVTTVRASGTIVSTTVSLGYDVHHARVEPLLEQAAIQCGLSEPFVQVQELGDYSVSYRVAGLLTEVKSLLTTRSELNRHVLDVLHEDGVEIASPAIMNQRRIDETGPIIPVRDRGAPRVSQSKAEEIAFDKADAAEAREAQRLELEKELAELATTAKSTPEAKDARLTERIQTLKTQIGDLNKPPEESS